MTQKVEKQGDPLRVLWSRRPAPDQGTAPRGQSFGGLLRLLEDTLAEDLARVERARRQTKKRV